MKTNKINKGRLITLLSFALTISPLFHVNANDYGDGSGFGKQVSGQGKDAMKGFNPNDAVEGYTSNPPEKGYWPGGTGTSTNIGEIGAQQLVTSEVGKSVTDSMINNPKTDISLDAPFLETGKNAQANAEGIVSGTGDFCEKQIMSNISFERFVCNRDATVSEVCTRTSTITGSWRNTTQLKYITIQPSQFRYSQNGATINFNFTAPVTGRISYATLQITAPDFVLLSTYSLLNSTLPGFSIGAAKVLTGAPGINITAGQVISGTSVHVNSGAAGIYTGMYTSGKAGHTLILHLTVDEQVWDPRVEWSEFCPFNKTDGALSQSVCTEAGGNKTVYVGGKPYVVYQACWAYRDTYVTQSASEGTCSALIKNPACTVVSRKCEAVSEDSGLCINEAVTFECEKVTKAEGMLCGGEFFCSDGKCQEVKEGQDNGFKKAVSQLAAVAAVGDDVAELNNIDIRAFTGKGQACRKTAVGFSNCCKDSGWGTDIGLASCKSEEKALGEAKQRKLTVEIGEYCSTKVLGVCLEKKRSSCVFDSKLAQIVQQQGRKWQLGIGFGSAKSPDCRGITIEELQRINFAELDFSNFYDDLEAGLEIPADDTLMQRVSEQIKAELSKKASEGSSK